MADTDWCTLEAHSCHSSSLPASVYSSLPTKWSRFTSNPVVLPTQKIWAQFRNHYKFTSPFPLSPICKNHLFSASSLDLTLTQWGRKQLPCFKSLYCKEGLIVLKIYARNMISHTVICSLLSLSSLPRQHGKK